MRKNARTILSVFGAAVLLALPAPAHATILASESFEGYTLGPLNGQGGGALNGWAGNWEPSISNPRAEVIDSSSKPLTYAVPGGEIIGGGTRALEVQLTGAATAVIAARRQLAAPLAQTFYVGYLLRYTPGDDQGTWAGANNTFTLHLGTNSTQTGTLNFGLRGNGAAGSDEFLIRFATGGPVTGASTGGQLENGRDYYLVAKVVHDGTAFTSAYLWLDPTATDETDTPEGDARLTGFSSPPITHLFWREAVLDANDILRADEVKIGTTFNDVVPLPASPPVPKIRVETAADGTGTLVPAQNITAGNSITLYAIARDAGGNFLSNTVAGWSLQNTSGGVQGGDLAPSADGMSAVFSARLIGTAEVRATANALSIENSGTLTVVAGPTATVRVETQPDGSGTIVPAQNLTPWTSVSGYAVTRDAGGNFLENVPATWSMPIRTSGVQVGDLVVSPDRLNATFTGMLSGTATLRAEYSGLPMVDSGLLTVSRSVTWAGGQGGNAWDFTTENWSESGTATRFYDEDEVTFDAGGSMSPAVNIKSDISPHSINVTGGPYTFGGSGRIAGNGALMNSSQTRLTLLTTNTYSGVTDISFGSELQLGNGVQNGSLGTGNVVIRTGGTSPIFNRTDPVSSPHVVSNNIGGPVDFTIEIKTGAVELKSPTANSHAKAVVRSGATLILSCGNTSIGANTALGGTNLIVENGATVKLGTPNAAGDHLTAAGRYVHVDGLFDANGLSEAFGVLAGSGTLDNTAASNCVLTINQGNSAVGDGGIGNGGEVYTFGGMIRNSGSGKLGITKDGTNTLILTSANTYGGDTRVIAGGVLELGQVNAIQNSTYDQQSGDSGTLSFGNLSSATLGGLKSGANKTLPLENKTGGAVALTIGGNGQNNSYAGVLSGPGSLVKTGSGVQTLSGASTFSGPITVSQGTLLVNGSLAGSGVTVQANGTLGGSGTISSPVVINGALRPGNNNIGKLTVNGSVTLSGATLIEISRTATPDADNLTATSIALGGTLTVTNAAGTPQPGDTYQLFSGSLSGSIAVAGLPELPPGMVWDTAALNSAGTLSVVGSSVPPSIGSAYVSGQTLVFSGVGGTPGGTYHVLSTNLLTAPLATWPSIATGTFGPDGNFTNTVPYSGATPQAWFTIQVP